MAAVGFSAVAFAAVAARTLVAFWGPVSEDGLFETSINIQREMKCTVEEAVERITAALAEQKFGVMTRIDMDTVLKKKIDKDVPRTVILGVCSPLLAYSAYKTNTAVASLLPCNCVIRQVRDGVVAVEVVRPTRLLQSVDDNRLCGVGVTAEAQLRAALASA